jgi:methionyl-tRNA synthetase
MPNRTEIVLNSFNAMGTTLNWGGLKSGSPLNPHPPLFPRIDLSETKQKQPDKSTTASDKTIKYEDFQKVDLRTAIILEATPVPDTDRLLKLKIRLGEEERAIVSGIAEHYAPEDLIGKMIVVVANLEPATIKGVKSRGMLLAANQGKALRLIVVDSDGVSSGVRVF